MSYKLTVVFSGVLAFVKHAKKDEYRVLVPLTKAGQTALDGRPLRSHLPHLRIEDELHVRPLPIGHRVEFDVSSGGGGGLTDNLSDMAKIEYGTGTSGTFSPALDSAALTRPYDPLWTFVEIDRGDLSAVAASRGSWTIDATTLGGRSRRYDLVSKIHWTVTGLTGNVDVSAVPFPGSGTASVTIVDLPTGSGDVEVHFHNFLSEDVTNQIFHPGAGHGDVDDDFRWYYELLAQRGPVRARLRGQPSGTSLPVPVRGGGAPHSLGVTHNCMPALFPEADW